MIRGINRVMLLGTVSRAPELKPLKSGANLLTVSLTTVEEWRDRDSGEVRQSTEHHRLSIMGSLASELAPVLKEGDALSVLGKIRTRRVGERYMTEISVNEAEQIQITTRGQPLPAQPMVPIFPPEVDFGADRKNPEPF